MVEIDGRTVPISQAPLKSNFQIGFGENEEWPEHLVRVDWIETLPVEEAYWETGMYANMNTVTKLRNKFTLERLTKHFRLEDD